MSLPGDDAGVVVIPQISATGDNDALDGVAEHPRDAGLGVLRLNLLTAEEEFEGSIDGLARRPNSSATVWDSSSAGWTGTTARLPVPTSSRRQRYPLPLTPEELQEEIVLLSPGKPGEHLIRFTLDLDVFNQAPGQQPADTLLPDLAFFRLLPTAEAVYLEWGERVLLVQPAQIQIRKLAFSNGLAPLRPRVGVTLALVQQGDTAGRYFTQLQEWSRAVGEWSAVTANPVARGSGPSPAGRGGIGLARDALGGLLGRVRR